MKKTILILITIASISCTVDFDDMNFYVDEIKLAEQINLSEALQTDPVIPSETISNTLTTTVSNTLYNDIQNKLDWVAYFNTWSVRDHSWLQYIEVQEQGFRVLFDFENNQINIPNMPTWSYPLDNQYRIENQNNIVVDLIKNESKRLATIPDESTHIRFVYKYSSDETLYTPYIEIKKLFNKFFVNFQGEITYSKN